ncbi:hypothetical protein SDC9_146287 [bioreactor metagenome]|uniref:Uncharacterized protein n=1 Tax=bioreactor metagenome TaxID=1076179 RepID=A0A645EAU9_9ZZZZ
MLFTPDLLLSNRIPRDQTAKRLTGGGPGIDQHSEVPADAGHRLPGLGFVVCPALVLLKHQWNVLRREVGQACLRAVGHRMPVVCAEGPGRRVEGLVWIACGRILDGAAIGIVSSRPVHRDKVLCRDELAIGAVDDEEEAVLWRMQDDLARFALQFDVGQDQVLCRGVVPVVCRRLLIMPDVFASVRFECDDGRGVQVVTTGRAAFAV